VADVVMIGIVFAHARSGSSVPDRRAQSGIPDEGTIEPEEVKVDLILHQSI